MAKRSICEVPECGKTHVATGFCRTHYMRSRRGIPLSKPMRRTRRRLCEVEGCLADHMAKGMCDTHYKQWEYHSFDPAKRPVKRSIFKYLDGNGYVTFTDRDHPLANAAGRVLEHRAIMAEMLGRPLLPGENVHHKNGDRADNRPENLELWVTLQPSGQRPEDLVAYAREIIARYA